MSKTFVLFGMTGAGKTYVASLLHDKLGLRRIKNTTTRPKRSDKDIEYNFVSEKDFLEDGGSRYVAIREYHTFIEDTPKTHYYGVDKNEMEKGGLIITDFVGFKELLSRNSEVIGIYIYADKTTRQLRSALREGYKVEEFERRNKDDSPFFKIEDIIAVGIDYPVYVVENDLDTSSEDLYNKIEMIVNNHK